MIKKVISILMICVMLVTISPAVAANVTSVQPTVEEILSEYHQRAFEAEYDENTDTVSAYSRGSGGTSQTLEQEAVEALTDAGYEAYHVTTDNYDTLEADLYTDFSGMGLDPNGSYIVVVSGEDQNDGISPTSTTPGSVGSSFSYTYNGTKYYLRYVTVTVADNPDCGLATTVDLLESKTLSTIEACLNSAVSVYLDALTPFFLGTIASICGLNIFEFSTSSTSTLNMNCATNWTVIYTQVWSAYDQMWLYGSSVEYVTVTSNMGGHYYSATYNRYMEVPSNSVSESFDSENCYNYTWRKEQAVRGYLSSQIYRDMISTVRYQYNGQVVVTHHSQFWP